jgi:hypothetical protein
MAIQLRSRRGAAKVQGANTPGNCSASWAYRRYPPCSRPHQNAVEKFYFDQRIKNFAGAFCVAMARVRKPDSVVEAYSGPIGLIIDPLLGDEVAA